VREAKPDGAELELVPIEVPAGGAAFHDGWTFDGSPSNQRADAERRSIVSHMISTATRWNRAGVHPIYSRYRRPGEFELDEAFFPVLWREGYSTPWLEAYFAKIG
jgi:2-oxoglutarate-dependent dioxygenase